MKFVIATKDYAGLGFAIRLRDEGHEVIVGTNPGNEELSDPERLVAYDLVGQGIVEKARLSDLVARRDEKRDWYWVWDFDHAVEENETLRTEGFKVLGGGRHADTMEHDRHACLEFTATYGLEAPPSFPFSDAREAIRFCETNSDTAYVYKPDSGANFETFLPESDEAEDANLELRMHLASLGEIGSFILQERKEGVETNVEVWIQDGEPVFAFMTLESKKKYVMDMGELVGCAFDFSFIIPLDCKAVTGSVGKLYPAYKKMRYTGFADANFIASRDGLWFFEKCERFGYNAHPNLLFNLSRRELGDVLASLVDGNLKPDFSGGFGATVTMSTKANPTGGKVIQFPPKLWKDIYWWDVFKKGDHYLTAGYDREGYVLILTAYGYTIPTAWEKTDESSRSDQVSVPQLSAGWRSHRLSLFPYPALRGAQGHGLHMKINIETIPHGEQRYPTVGDYWDDENGVIQVRVSDMKDWRYEALVVLHELIEMFLTKHRGIPEHEISEFDIKFEQSRGDQLVCGEPGDHPKAPYRSEHFFATNLERLFSSELGIDWFEYDRDVDALGIKK